MIEYYCGIKTKPVYPGNLKANTIIETIHKVLVNLGCTYNLQETYLDDKDPRMDILAAADFAVYYAYPRVEGEIPGQIFFRQDMILPIAHVANWKYIRQRKQVYMDHYVIHEIST